MANYLTAEDLIASVKNRALIPDNQVTFETEDFLSFANEELIIGLVPTVLLYHEDYLLYTQSTALVANKSNYKIPYRAIGNKLRELSYQDLNHNVYEMSRLPIDDVSEYQGSSTVTNLQHYYVRNNEIILVPNLGESVVGDLLFSYYLRPNNLVTNDKIAVIQSINTGTGEIFVNSVPESFSTATKIDFIKVENPFKCLSFDATPTSISSSTNTITFSANDIPSELAAGDHIALAGETNIIQLPADLHVMLAHRVAIRCLEALGDTQGLQNASAKLQEMEKNMGSLIDNRVEASPQKVSLRWSPLRLSNLRRRRWFRR